MQTAALYKILAKALNDKIFLTIVFKAQDLP